MSAAPAPNFFLVGGKKCGTTSLFRQLASHPAIAFPHKEIHYFSYVGTSGSRPSTVVTSEEEYRQLYAPLASFPVRGDASPSYLTLAAAAPRIREAVPDARVVAVLRHPVDRMFSDYLHERRAGREPAATFEAALAAEDGTGHQYAAKSTYSRHIERYRALFPDDQLRFLLYDDYVADPVGFVQSLYAFLGVDADHVPPAPGQRTKRSGHARSRLVEQVTGAPALRRVARRAVPGRLHAKVAYGVYNANTTRPAMAPAVRRHLLERFAPDVAEVEALLQRDLGAWRR